MGLVHSQRERDLVADALGDSPETAIPTHLLRRGLCVRVRGWSDFAV